MKAMRPLIMFLSIALLAACGSGDKTPESGSAASIRSMEDSLFNSGSFDPRKAQALIDVYKAYANANPKDSLAPEYLFRAANMCKTMHEGEQGIKLYDRIIREYPTWPKLADAFYLKAFTLDSETESMGEAKEAYETVIRLFPDHPFAKDARAMIDNLGYTDAELIERFQRMQDSAVVAQ